MDSLQATYRDEDDEEGEPAHGAVAASEAETIDPSKHASEPELEDESSEEPPSEETGKHRQKRPKIDENDDEEDDDDDDEGRGGGEGEVEEEEEEEEEEVASPKRRRRASLVVLDSGCEEQLGDKKRSASPPEMAISNGLGEANVSAHGMSKSSAVAAGPNSSNGKKSKKKSSSVWVTKTTRKGKKKNKGSNNGNHIAPVEETVLITPVTRFPDRNDDSPVMTICLSKVYKAEKVEVSNDRMSASSSKGYRMVRATRGVVGGAWYFEIKVEKLGETGHTRLGWSLEKGDLQAPVGYDGSSFGYRDIDGSKVHKAMREKYGEEGYKEGDVIGFYLNLPDGELYAPKPPQMVWYKGQRYVCAPDPKEGTPKVVPGSEISFFKNGVCQGIAFKDLHGGRYYPAASMYTLPNQPNCVVRFNFGPVFECFPDSFEGRPAPRPMIEVPYHGYDGSFENGGPTEQKDDQKLPEISNFRRLRY